MTGALGLFQNLWDTSYHSALDQLDNRGISQHVHVPHIVDLRDGIEERKATAEFNHASGELQTALKGKGIPTPAKNTPPSKPPVSGIPFLKNGTGVSLSKGPLNASIAPAFSPFSGEISSTPHGNSPFPEVDKFIKAANKKKTRGIASVQEKQFDEILPLARFLALRKK